MDVGTVGSDPLTAAQEKSIARATANLGDPVYRLEYGDFDDFMAPEASTIVLQYQYALCRHEILIRDNVTTC